MEVELQQDEDGNLLLPLDEYTTARLGWGVGTVVRLTDNRDGTFTLSEVSDE